MYELLARNSVILMRHLFRLLQFPNFRGDVEVIVPAACIFIDRLHFKIVGEGWNYKVRRLGNFVGFFHLEIWMSLVPKLSSSF